MATRRRGISNFQQEDGSAGDMGAHLQRLRIEVEELMQLVDTMPVKITELDAKLREIGRAMREVEVRVVQHDASVRDMSGVVKRLGARVEWLERNIRLQEGAAEAELDDVGRAEIELAAVADSGHRARTGLLTGAARSALEADVQAHATAVRSHGQHREQAIDACEVLAQTDWTDDRHRAAASRFRQAADDTAQARKSIKRLAGPALQAAQQLAGDEERHRAVADVVVQGEHAWTQLSQLLRARVADAVGSGALLPAWFTSVLGPIPPAQDTRRWMEAATALLAYRVTYAVSDPILALGPAPEQAAGARQRSWYDQLTRQLRDLQT